jgi:hypothetical protein
VYDSQKSEKIETKSGSRVLTRQNYPELSPSLATERMLRTQQELIGGQ